MGLLLLTANDTFTEAWVDFGSDYIRQHVLERHQELPDRYPNILKTGICMADHDRYSQAFLMKEDFPDAKYSTIIDKVYDSCFSLTDITEMIIHSI